MSKPILLIAEDEPDLRDNLVRFFKRKDFDVLEAECGNKAIEILNNNKVDIVLSDYRMPNGTGKDILEFINTLPEPRPKLMFLTAFSDVSRQEALDLGALEVFNKPVDRKDVLARVIEILG